MCLAVNTDFLKIIWHIQEIPKSKHLKKNKKQKHQFANEQRIGTCNSQKRKPKWL